MLFSFDQMKMMSLFMFVKEIQKQTQLKYGLPKIGDCILANNNSRIPVQDLKKIYRAIQYNFFLITTKWKERFDITEVKFYC